MENNEKGTDLTNAFDRREWLISKGLAEPGRGRFSNAAKEAMAEAERNGVIFIDKGAVVAAVKTVGEDGKIVEVKREVNIWAPHAPAIRDGYLTFVGEGKKKERTELKVNSSEVCETCSYSFSWCYCEVPVFRHWKTGEALHLADW